MKHLWGKEAFQIHFLFFGMILGSFGLILLKWMHQHYQSLAVHTPSKTGPMIVLGKKCSPNPDECLLGRLKYAKQHKAWAERIVFSGGGKTKSEAQWMKEWWGNAETLVPLLEDQSRDTSENLKLSKRMLPHTHVLIVTSHYHARRVRLMATRHFSSYEVFGAPAKVSVWRHMLEAVHAGWIETGLRWTAFTRQLNWLT